MSKGIKTGGRVKGTPNRTTVETKSIIHNIVNKELENLPKILDELKPRERIEIIVKLLVYVVPKQNQLGIEDKTTSKTMTIINLGNGLKPDENF